MKKFIIKFIENFQKKSKLKHTLKKTNSNIYNNHLKIKEKNKKKISVAFLVQFPEMWNSFKSVYNEMKNDIRFETAIFTVPKIVKSNILFKTFSEENVAQNFFKNNNYKSFPIDPNNKKSIDLDYYDYIFIQRPYDAYMPEFLSQYKIADHSLVCYIPYGFQFVKGFHLDVEYNQSALDNQYMVFADNIDSYSYCMSTIPKHIYPENKKIFNLGYPRFDLISREEEIDGNKNFLWLPRWSTSDENDKSSFLDYYEYFLNYFEKNEDINLIIRPHPLMFKNFIETGVLDKSKLDEIIERIEKIKNVSLDKNTDYLQTFSNTDVLIADFTSLLIEFFLTKKPIIYCGKTDDFNSIGKIMESGMYMSDRIEGILNIVSNISKGKDNMKDIRSEAVEKIYDSKDNVAKKIVDALYDDARNYFINKKTGGL